MFLVVLILRRKYFATMSHSVIATLMDRRCYAGIRRTEVDGQTHGPMPLPETPTGFSRYSPQRHRATSIDRPH
jgi:hypothetical protein